MFGLLAEQSGEMCLLLWSCSQCFRYNVSLSCASPSFWIVRLDLPQRLQRSNRVACALCFSCEEWHKLAKSGRCLVPSSISMTLRFQLAVSWSDNSDRTFLLSLQSFGISNDLMLNVAASQLCRKCAKSLCWCNFGAGLQAYPCRPLQLKLGCRIFHQEFPPCNSGGRICTN